MKQVFLDVETSGLSTYNNGIWQLSAIIVIDGKEYERFNEKCKLFPGQEWDIEVAGMFEEAYAAYETFPEPQTVFNKLEAFLKTYINPFDRNDKALMYGYNVKYDEGFIRKFWKNNNNNFFGSWFCTPSIDIMSLAAERLKEVRSQMPNFKLGTVANYLDIEINEDRLHDAMYDTELTYQIYQLVTNEQKSK